MFKHLFRFIAQHLWFAVMLLTILLLVFLENTFDLIRQEIESLLLIGFALVLPLILLGVWPRLTEKKKPASSENRPSRRID